MQQDCSADPVGAAVNARDRIAGLLQGNFVQPIHVQGADPRMGLQRRLCNPSLSMLNYSREQSLTFQLQIVRSGNGNRLYTAATQLSLL